MNPKLNHVTSKLTWPRSFSREMPSSVRRLIEVLAMTCAFPESMGTNPRNCVEIVRAAVNKVRGGCFVSN